LFFEKRKVYPRFSKESKAAEPQKSSKFDFPHFFQQLFKVPSFGQSLHQPQKSCCAHNTPREFVAKLRHS